MAQGNVETVIAEANHLKYRVYGFDIGSSDVLKPGIKEMLDYIVEELKAVNVLQVAITGLASESQLKGEGAYIYGLERAEAVKRYLAGSKATYSITAISVGSTSAPSASASPREKAYARAVIIDIRYTGSLPGINIELKPGPLDWNKIEQGKERMLTQEAREHRELPVFKQSNLAGYTYRYDHIIGLERHSSDLVDDLHTVLWALEGNPSNYFPFNVEGQSGEKSIVLGSEYDLVNKPGKLFPLPPGRHPIKVTEVTEHSFTFTTLEGHFDTPGSTITFTIYKDINGIIHLEQYGVALPSKEPSFKFLLAPDMAKFAWDEQADNLRKWLESAGQHPLLLPGK